MFSQTGLYSISLVTLLTLAVSGCAQIPFLSSHKESKQDIQKTTSGKKTTELSTANQNQKRMQFSTLKTQPLEREKKHPDSLNTNPENFELPVKPNECWVQTVIEPTPVKTTVEVVIRDAVNKISVLPAQFARQDKEIIIKQGATTYRVQPPIYKSVQEKIITRPEVRKSVVEPAVYETKTSTITIQSAHTKLVSCNDHTPYNSVKLPSSTQSLCAQEVPAKTKQLTRKILVKPETTRVIVQPPKYKTITKQVLVQPAKVIPIKIAAQTKDINVIDVARNEKIEEQQIPPEIRKLTATHYEGEPKLVFRRAVCSKNMTPTLVKSLQEALREKDINAGPVDGKYGQYTQKALLQYQRQNGLAYGALTYETLNSLNIRTDNQ